MKARAASPFMSKHNRFRSAGPSFQERNSVAQFYLISVIETCDKAEKATEYFVSL
jgi:hypothetical protein